MGPIERIFHSVLLEVLAIVLSTLGLLAFTSHEVSTLSGTMIAVSIIAMVWSFFFNYLFDFIFTGKREKRSIVLRIVHVTLFEIGLWIFTLPVIAILLDVSLWEAFVMDVGVTIFITIYTFVYNYLYDHIRVYFINGYRSLCNL